MKRRLLVLGIVILLSAAGLASADKKKDKIEATDKALAALTTVFAQGFKALKIDVRELVLSGHTQIDGKIRFWLTVYYPDPSSDGDVLELFKVMSVCQGLAEMAEIDLSEIEARPIIGNAGNTRAVIMAPLGRGNAAAKQFNDAIMSCAASGTLDKKALGGWIKTWTVRGFDPKMDDGS